MANAAASSRGVALALAEAVEPGGMVGPCFRVGPYAYCGASTAEELVKNAAAIGPEHQHHTHQRASGHHTRRYRQGELFGELWSPSLEQERNEGAQEEQKPIVPGKHPGETER